MNEPNETPEGRLAEYLVGDLGPARRLIRCILNGEMPAARGALGDIESSIERCVRRIERDMPPNTLVSDPEPATSTLKVANPKDSLHQPVVLGMGSKTILPEGR